MLFNSYEFIFIFLPIVLFFYFILNKLRLTYIAKLWLVAGSLFFYGWWNRRYLPIIILSILFNCLIAKSLTLNVFSSYRKKIFIFGICFNLILLVFYKYLDFLIGNINIFTKADLSFYKIDLPLGISFFTFTQIAYLIDTFKQQVRYYSLLNYSLFVTFFPHLLAGPIIHHNEMMPQFDRLKNKVFSFANLGKGVSLFTIGLFKKVVIADTVSLWANQGFDTMAPLSFIEAWLTSLSYTIQIYFDFSGYTDMALGAALMFNIKLPFNFNSPYKSANIQDFWRRWHITLSRFMRNYIYIPLGGNRGMEFKVISNILITFLIGGLWHGAGWTFVFWGLLHGTAFIVYRQWQKLGYRIPHFFSWFITFNFVNITWIFFRAKEWKYAENLLKGMLGFNGLIIDYKFQDLLARFNVNNYGFRFGRWETLFDSSIILPIILIGLGISIFWKNSNEIVSSLQPRFIFSILFSILFFISILCIKRHSEFIYFRF